MFCTPLDAGQTPHALARHGLKNGRTGADVDLIPLDEAPAPSDDAGAARIIVGTH